MVSEQEAEVCRPPTSCQELLREWLPSVESESPLPSSLPLHVGLGMPSLHYNMNTNKYFLALGTWRPLRTFSKIFLCFSFVIELEEQKPGYSRLRMWPTAGSWPE